MKRPNAIILGVVATAIMSVTPLLHAADFSLTAAAGSVSMPDGSPPIPVWGLVQGPLVPGTNSPLTPVPVLTDVAGATLTITLTNDLLEPVSLTINGQPIADPIAPVFFTDANGRQRVQSFMHETLPGASETYSWGPLKAGTYLITSGTHPSVQVPMGLYAVLKVDEAAGVAYPATTFNPATSYTSEATILFSEIDPALNNAVASGIYGDPAGAYPTALKVGYKPKYFLLNGRPWSSTAPPLASVTAGGSVLLRMLNAGLRPRMPIFPGQTLTMIAEDGNPYNFQSTQYTADLVAGKTIDALLTAPAVEGNLLLHDRMLGLANGGMLGYLAVGTPSVNLTVEVIGTGSVSATSLPGGIVACTDPPTTGLCSATYLNGTSVTLHAVPASPDSALSGWNVTFDADGTPTGECTGGGDCIVTLDAPKTVSATFTNYPTTTLLYPNGGEVIPLDATVPVRWAAPADVYTFDIGYANGPGAPFRKIADRVAGREFLWNLAAWNVRPSAAVRLAIVGYDATGTVVSRDSIDAPFATISPITLTAPNGGEALTVGTPVDITWNMRLSTPTTVRASLWFQAASGAPWSLIADVDPTFGIYAWTPTTTHIGATARIAMTVYNADGKAIGTDTSDNTFSVAAAVAPLSHGAVFGVSPVAPDSSPAATGSADPGMVLLSPNGGEILAAEAPFTVLWQAPAQAVSYSLDYSLDGGQNWRKLVRDLVDTQFDWIIDSELRGNTSMLLQVTAFDADGKELAQDRSDETFRVD